VITRIQRIVRKAIKDYQIQSSVGEEALVAFISVDILRELNSMNSASDPQANSKPIKKKEEKKIGEATAIQVESAR